MAFELYGMLAGNVSPTTGENVKPAYGGEEEAFLKKVVTPIYKVIEKVQFLNAPLFFFLKHSYIVCNFYIGSREEQDCKVKALTMEKL